MALYARISSGVVTNLVAWNGSSPYNVMPDTLVSATGQPNAQIGGTYAGGVFTAPAAPTPAQGIVFQNSPVNGATVALPNASQPQAILYAYLQPAVALATLTLTLPPTPQDGDQLCILSTKAITALTLAGGNALNFSPTFAVTAGVSQRATFSAQLNGWFYV